ncbi:MAG: hypothetical protein PHH26_04430 [Candidatus Thermoplasmatota archaeon]|nr:hypothetical protein [Candidatus Thermoplasmatota archaeon]
MIHTTLSTVLDVFSAGFFAVIGIFILGRQRRESYSRPMNLFGVWWILLGAIKAIEIFIRIMMYDYGITALNVPMYSIYWTIGPIATFCLLYYTLFLFTGHEKWRIPIIVFYAAIIIAIVAVILTSGPYVALDDAPFYLNQPGNIAYAKPVPDYLALLIIGAIEVPQISVCIALYSLYRKMEKPTQKYRLVMVATSLLLIFVSGFVSFIAGKTDELAWETVYRAIYLLSAILVYVAYRPPYSIRRKYGVMSILEEKSGEKSSSANSSE